MKKTLILNDEPLLHLAFDLMLEKVPTEVLHVAKEADLLAKLSPDVCAVILDLGAKHVNPAAIVTAMRKSCPHASLICFGGGPQAPKTGWTKFFYTATPHSDRDKIAELVRVAAVEKTSSG